MKKVFALILSLAFTVTLFAAEEAVLKTDYYPNGNLQYAGYTVVKGEAGQIPHGYWQYFYPNGYLKSCGYFKEGYRTKVWTNFFSNGKVESYGPYDEGKKDGRWYFFFPVGAKKAEGKFSDGLAKGSWTYWHTNGVVETEGDFKEGKRVGKRAYYDERGNKLWYGRFKDDEKDGEWRLDEKDKTTIATYKAGVLLGQREESYYDEDHDDIKTKTEFEVVHGKLTGSQIVTTYDEDENITSQGLLFNNTPYGVWRYYEDKKMTQQENGAVPEALKERRRAIEEEYQMRIQQKAKEEALKAQGIDPRSQQQQAQFYNSDEPFEYGPRKFQVIMQAPSQLDMNVTTDSGRSIDLTENHYDVVKENPGSFESLKQQALRAQAAKMTENVGEGEEK